MAKVNEFETATYNYTSSTKQRFSDESNIHYTFSSAEDLLNKPDEISKIIQHHEEHQRPRLRELREYYKGDNATILQANRRKEEHLADHRATHNFAKYVTDFNTGYMMGIPLKTTHPEENINELIRDMNRDNDADEHNTELTRDVSMYGRAYELLWRGVDDKVYFTNLDVLETFVIYDDTVEMKPIAAVRYIGDRFGEDETKVFLYTDSKIYTYKLDNAYKLTISKEEQHYFEGVPIVEYDNNKFRQGDYEDVLNLIDLYDSAQSDTANYMQDFNDAMLKIVGNLDIDVAAAKEMKEHNILMLQTEMDGEGRTGQADADYIYKQYDVQGTEAYKDRIFNNILLFTSTPNLLDDKKSSTPQSGEALKMKLFSLAQKRATKERLFKKSLRDRYRLINNILSRASEAEFNVNDLSITFTENLPKSIDKELEWFAAMGGRLSNKTLLSQLSFIENPEEEMELIEQEDALSKNDYNFDVVEDGE